MAELTELQRRIRLDLEDQIGRLRALHDMLDGRAEQRDRVGQVLDLVREARDNLTTRIEDEAEEEHGD